MLIYLNGEARQVTENCSMSELVDLLDLAGLRIAVEVNEELVPRSTFESYQVGESDRVEIVHAIGGG